MDMGLFRFLIDIRGDKQKQGTTIASAFGYIVVQSLCCLAILTVVRCFTENTNLIYLLLNVVIASVTAMMQQTSRGVGDNTSYAISSFIAAAVQICSNILLICGLGMRTEALYISFFVGNLACSAYLAIKLRLLRLIRDAKFSMALLREMLSYSVPLVPNTMSWWLVNTVDRTVVAAVLGTAANGLLAISHKFSSLYATGISIFIFPWTESAVLHFHDADRDEFFCSVIHSMIRLFYAACIGLIACMPFLFPILIDIQFVAAYKQIPLYVMAAFLNTIVGLYSVVFQAVKKTKYIAVTSGLAAIISLLVNIILIRSMDLYAPAVASVCAYGVFATVRYRDARKYINVPLERRVLFLGGVVLCIVLIGYYSSYWLLKVFSLLCAIVFAVTTNIGFLKGLFMRKTTDLQK